MRDAIALAEHAARFAARRIAPGFLERDDTRVLDRALIEDFLRCRQVSSSSAPGGAR